MDGDWRHVATGCNALVLIIILRNRYRGRSKICLRQDCRGERSWRLCVTYL